MTNTVDVKYILMASIIVYSTITFSESSRLKFTKVTCELLDKSVATVSACRLKAVSRYLQYIQLNFILHDLPITDFEWRFAFMKRANGYKPFLYNFTFRCDFIKHLNPVSRIMWTWFKDNTNINHSCPINSDFHMERLENVYIQNALEKLPVPLGDYALFTYSSLNNKSTINLKFYGTIY